MPVDSPPSIHLLVCVIQHHRIMDDSLEMMKDVYLGDVNDIIKAKLDLLFNFKTEDEVIKLMNDNKYGLSSGVYTSNLARSMRVSKSIRAGIVFVNTYRLISPVAPFGGIKDSGYGKEAGIESIKDYTRIKTTWYNSSDKPMADPFTMG